MAIAWKNHTIQSNDALNVNKMNVGPGGKNTPVMRDTMWEGRFFLYDRYYGTKYWSESVPGTTKISIQRGNAEAEYGQRIIKS